jgi:hypothetical protein
MTERDTLVQRLQREAGIARTFGADEDVRNWRLALTPREVDELAAALAVVPLLEPQQKQEDLTRIGQPDADPPPQHASTNGKARC